MPLRFTSAVGQPELELMVLHSDWPRKPLMHLVSSPTVTESLPSQSPAQVVTMSWVFAPMAPFNGVSVVSAAATVLVSSSRGSATGATGRGGLKLGVQDSPSQ